MNYFVPFYITLLKPPGWLLDRLLLSNKVLLASACILLPYNGYHSYFLCRMPNRPILGSTPANLHSWNRPLSIFTCSSVSINKLVHSIKKKNSGLSCKKGHKLHFFRHNFILSKTWKWKTASHRRYASSWGMGLTKLHFSCFNPHQPINQGKAWLSNAL